jgi:hypothetical protein
MYVIFSLYIESFVIMLLKVTLEIFSSHYLHVRCTHLNVVHGVGLTPITSKALHVLTFYDFFASPLGMKH